MAVNKVILIGNLGKDPELKQTQNGTAVATFSIATSETYKDKTGNKQEKTEWHNIVVWQRLAEICNQYLHKGKQVYIEGRLQTRKWQDRDGNDRYSTEIVANQMQMLGNKNDNGQQQQQSQPQQQQQQPQQQQQQQPQQVQQQRQEPVFNSDDEIPF